MLLFGAFQPALAKTAADYLKEAKALGDSNEALVIKLATRALELDPRNAEAYDIRATAYSRKKRYIEAIADANHALRLNPKQAHAYAIRAKAGYLCGEASNESVVRDVETAVKLDPKVDDGYYLLGVIYSAQKQNKLACAAYDKAKVLKPKDRMLWRFSSAAHSELGEMDKALADMSMFVKLAPTDGSGYISRAGIYQILKQPDKALADYAKAIEVEPSEYPHRMRRAAYLITLGKHKEAIDDYSAAIKLNDVDEDLFLRRGNEYAVLKKYDKALADYNEAIAIARNYEAAYRARAKVYHEIGKPDLATKDRAKANELSRRPAEQKI